MNTDMTWVVSISLVGIMALALIGVSVLIAIDRRSQDQPTDQGVRTVRRFTRRRIQFLSVALLLPSLTLLALNKLVSGEVVGALLGTFIGYVLSGIGEKSEGK